MGTMHNRTPDVREEEEEEEEEEDNRTLSLSLPLCMVGLGHKLHIQSKAYPTLHRDDYPDLAAMFYFLAFNSGSVLSGNAFRYIRLPV